ncbi:MAG: hypothetical protein ACI4VF_08705, partial [Lachnospirales bacterium]
MKKSFKRFLSSVLATVVAVASMSFGMVTTASAGTVTTSSTTKTWDYSSGNTTATLSAGYNLDGIIIDEVGSGVKVATSNLSFKDGAKISIPVPTGSAGTLTLYASADQSTRYATLEGNNIYMAKPSSSGDFTTAETADGDLDVSFAGGEFKPTKIEVTLTTGSFGEVKTYTLTGNCSGLVAGTEFTLSDGTNDYSATVDEGGATYTVTTQSGAFDTSKEYTVTLRDYSANSVTITAVDDTNFTSSDITFTKLDFLDVPANTYTYSKINGGLPYFDLTGVTAGLSDGKYTGDIKVKLSDVATITVNGKCGSSDTSKSASVTINGEVKTSIGKSSAEDFVFSNVPAGEQTISFTSADTTFQVTSITISYGATSTESSSESTTFSVESSSESTTFLVEPSSESTTFSIEGNAISDKASLTFDSFVGTDTKVSDVVLSDYFTIIAGSGSIIETNNYTYEGLDKFSSRYKTGGKTTLDSTTGVPTNRAIKFTTEGLGLVQIVARGSGSSSRTLSVYNSTGDVLGTATSVDQEGCLLTLNLPKADTYYIAANDGFTIY